MSIVFYCRNFLYLSCFTPGVVSQNDENVHSQNYTHESTPATNRQSILYNPEEDQTKDLEITTDKSKLISQEPIYENIKQLLQRVEDPQLFDGHIYNIGTKDLMKNKKNVTDEELELSSTQKTTWAREMLNIDEDALFMKKIQAYQAYINSNTPIRYINRNKDNVSQIVKIIEIMQTQCKNFFLNQRFAMYTLICGYFICWDYDTQTVKIYKNIEISKDYEVDATKSHKLVYTTKTEPELLMDETTVNSNKKAWICEAKSCSSLKPDITPLDSLPTDRKSKVTNEEPTANTENMRRSDTYSFDNEFDGEENTFDINPKKIKIRWRLKFATDIESKYDKKGNVTITVTTKNYFDDINQSFEGSYDTEIITTSVFNHISESFSFQFYGENTSETTEETSIDDVTDPTHSQLRKYLDIYEFTLMRGVSYIEQSILQKVLPEEKTWILTLYPLLDRQPMEKLNISKKSFTALSNAFSNLQGIYRMTLIKNLIPHTGLIQKCLQYLKSFKQLYFDMKDKDFVAKKIKKRDYKRVLCLAKQLVYTGKYLEELTNEQIMEEFLRCHKVLKMFFDNMQNGEMCIENVLSLFASRNADFSSNYTYFYTMDDDHILDEVIKKRAEKLYFFNKERNSLLISVPVTLIKKILLHYQLPKTQVNRKTDDEHKQHIKTASFVLVANDLMLKCEMLKKVEDELNMHVNNEETYKNVVLKCLAEICEPAKFVLDPRNANNLGDNLKFLCRTSIFTSLIKNCEYKKQLEDKIFKCFERSDTPLFTKLFLSLENAISNTRSVASLKLDIIADLKRYFNQEFGILLEKNQQLSKMESKAKNIMCCR